MKGKEEYKETVNSVLTGIIEGIMQARQETAKDGALIAPGNRPVEINFQIGIQAGMSHATLKIPLAIPVQQATVKTDENPPLPVTPDTKIRDTDLSERVKNGLIYKEVETVRDLLQLTPGELYTYRNIGHTSLQEIETFLTRNGFYTEPAGDSVNLENT
jgi:DNA-directed RNA polymerase alpha subunit